MRTILPALALLAGLSSAAYAQEEHNYGPDLYGQLDVGLAVDAKAEVVGAPSSLNIENPWLLQGRVGVDYGRYAFDLTIARESGQLNFGSGHFDVHADSILLGGELDLYKGAFARLGAGVSQLEAGLAPIAIQSSDTFTWEAGAGYRPAGGPFSVSAVFRYTDGADFGPAQVDVPRTLIYGSYRF